VVDRGALVACRPARSRASGKETKIQISSTEIHESKRNLAFESEIKKLENGTRKVSVRSGEICKNSPPRNKLKMELFKINQSGKV
jgi:hypothetical protein